MADVSTQIAPDDDRELLDLLLAEEGVAGAPRLTRRPADAPVTLSFAQQRLWFLQQLDPASAAYNVVAAVRLDGRLDRAALEAAVNDVVARHEVLRTAFPTDDGRVAPKIEADATVRIAWHDWTAQTGTERIEATTQLQDEEAARIFDLARAPLCRLSVARLSEVEHVTVLTMHHIVSDAWSMDVLVRELGAAYAARAGGQSPGWPALPVQYADFAAWQRAWLDTGVRAAQLDYWRRQLANPPTLELKGDRPRPARPDFAGAAHAFELPAEIAGAVRRIADAEQATVFMVLLAAFQMWLHRTTGQEDLAVGAPVANRTRSELEPLIGFFVNTLVLRADFSDAPSFRALLRQARGTALAAYANQDVPFEDLVQELQPERELSQNPLFQAMFSVQRASRERMEMPGLAVTALPVASRVAKFDLMLGFEESETEIRGAFEYRTALFDAASVERMAGHFVQLLTEALRTPDAPLGTLRMMTAAEEKCVLHEWNATAWDYPQRTMAELFAEQAATRPEAPAVCAGGAVLSYAELNARANRLAHRLRANGVRPDTCVAVALERSSEAIVALLAIVKAGGAYAAIDPDYPAERRELMLADLRAPVVVTQEKFAERFASGAGVICVDRDAAEIAEEPAHDLEERSTLDGLAYVSFTSGSTGRPKGVAVPQRGVVRLVKNTDFATFGPTEVFLQFAPVAFDASTLEIWGPLLNGGSLVVMPPGTPSLEEIGRTIREKGVTTLWLTAGLFHAMVDERIEDLRGVNQLLAGGDVLSVSHVRKFLRALPGCRLINGYGPTENTTFTCCHTIREEDLASGSVPIGRPIANTTVYVLDAHLQPAPIGVPGELYTGGDGLARGYLNRPELTAEKFVPDSSVAAPGLCHVIRDKDRGARLYRTGDRVRWRADGTLEFLGRLDGQVKIRGYRIEPGESEAALLAEPGVKAAAVVVREEAGRKQLVGYAVADRGGETLRARLQERLPDYLVPSVIVTLDALPLTANGKVNRAALPAPRTEATREGGAAPRSAVECEIAAVWQAVLGLEQVGVDENYFSVGGDSITAIQVASRLRRAGWEIEVRDLFQYPTIAALAPRLRRAAQNDAVNEEVSGPVPLTPAQAWFFARHTMDRHHFNQAVLLQPRETLPSAAVGATIAQLWRHHDALRTVFAGTAARILPAETAPSFTEVRVADEVERLAHSGQVQRGFDLAQGPLFKAVLYRMATGDRLLLVAHHLVVDGVSWRVLLEDFEIGLRQFARKEEIDFGLKSNSVRAWAEAAARRPTRADEENYWSEAGAGAGHGRRWPEVDSRAANVFGATHVVAQELAESTTRALLTSAHAAYHTEINDLLLVALGRALRRWHGSETTAVTLEGHGRDAETGLPQIDRTVGWFTTLFPIVLTTRGDDLGGQIKMVKEMLRAVPAKGIGFALETYLKRTRPLASADEPRISFNYLGQFGEESGGRLAFAGESAGTPIGGGVERAHEIDATALVGRGKLAMSLTFVPGRYPAPAMEKLLGDWRAEIETVVAHCVARNTSEKTPADFTSRRLTLPAYEALLQGRGWAAADVEDVCALSPMQAGLLFQSVFESGSTAYCIQLAYRLRGRLDMPRMAAAWRQLANRHAILRTNFVHQGVDEALQLVWRTRASEVTATDLRSSEAGEQARRIALARAEDLRRGFDLERGGLWRVAIWQLADDAFEVLWSYHHVLLDGWSVGIVHRDLLRLYAGETLPAAAPYRDYLRWLARKEPVAAREFWKNYLAGYEQPATLPRWTRGGADAPMDAGDHVVDLGVELSAALRTLAAHTGVTLNTVLQTAWGLLLARLNRVEDVVFGAVVSGRPAELPGVEEMVGLFICTMPVRVKAAGDAPFSTALREAQAAALAAEPHHHLPIAEIQTLTPLGRELFDHLLVFENYPMERALRADADKDALRVEHVEAHDRTHYDLDLTIDPGEAITIKFGYNRNLHPDAQIAQVGGNLRRVLEQAAAAPETKVAKISLVTPAERAQLLDGFNATAMPYPERETLQSLIEAQAGAAPQRIAAVHNGRSLTYAELNAQANRLARRLQQAGVARGAFVGILDERGLDFLAAMVAILKAGAAFIPIDPGYPEERVRHMVRDSAVAVLITRREIAARFSLENASAALRHLVLLDDVAAEDERNAENLGIAGEPTDAAYMLYTSGSTGLPKGAIVRHNGAVNHIFAQFRELAFHADTAFLQSAPSSSDISVWQFLAPLLIGGRTVIADFETVCDPRRLFAAIRDEAITLMELVPVALKELLDYAATLPAAQRALPALEFAMVTGESVSVAVVNQWFATYPRVRLANAYGPTEAADDICQALLDGPLPADATSAPIGRPLGNLTLYVLDPHLQLVPVGAPGEICVSGVGVGAGYWRNEEKTRAAFVSNPYAEGRRGDTIYRTGDLGRWLPDGNLEMLGRIDHQVKVRGFRIELGEIEARLRTHPVVREVVVVARPVGGTSELVAYVVASGAWEPAALRAHLLAELPEHMAPAYWVRLETLPLLPNGKIDRRALPAPEAEAVARSAAFIAPRTATEEKIAAIWREVLQRETVGVEDNFFELGGHSLKAMQIVSRVQQAFGVRPELREFFDAPTVAALAARVEGGARDGDAMAVIPRAPQQEHYPLSYAQQRLWLLHQLGGQTAYNMPEAYWLETEVDAAALERAFQQLVARHEALRTAFVVVDSEPRQKILDEVAFALRRVDLSGDPAAEEKARALADREAAAPFDLAQPPLLRATLIALGPRRSVFLFTVHHIVGDGWSGNVLYREVFALYAAIRRGAADPLEPLRIHYKDFAVWQKARALTRDAAYWRKALAGVPDALALPYDFPPRAERDFRGDYERAEIEAGVADGLRRLARAKRTTLSNVVLAVFKLVLFQVTKQEDFCIGVSVANRNHPELENLIGFFVNLLPVRTRFGENMEFDELLAQVAARAGEAFEHQEYPFDLLVQEVNPQRTNNRQPLVNVVYGFQNFLDVHVDIGERAPAAGEAPRAPDELAAARPFEHAFKTSKFDLTLFVDDHGEAGKLAFTLEYDTGLFRAETIRKYLGLLKRFAGLVAAAQN